MKFENKPTKIVYKPHCGNCGALINNDVSYYDVYEKRCEFMLPNKVYTEVFPYICTNCGAQFNGIEITPPEKLHDVFLGEDNKWEL